jgi:hypothetical protein
MLIDQNTNTAVPSFGAIGIFQPRVNRLTFSLDVGIQLSAFRVDQEFDINNPVQLNVYLGRLGRSL